MKKFYQLTLAVVASMAAMSATAATLSPEEAFDAARAVMQSCPSMKAPASSMKLVYTESLNQMPCVYVFANERGFVMAAADDAATPLIGYSDSSTFDPNNIPPALTWALEQYAARIDGLNNTGMRSIKKAPAKAPEAIAPILKTTWGQDAPYNKYCPVIEGTQAPTGCVATAIAQVMFVHKYPECGTGSKSYDFKYNGKTYTASADFEANPLKWDLMLDTYLNVDYTEEQADAVANLMYQVGVASSMAYAPNQSGAWEQETANCLIEQFGYDPGMISYQREWFSDENWNEIIYNELKNGRPVPYGGNNGKEGHEFVCDGYNGSGYYHFNWGWDGMSDGYFSLDDLNPLNQGTGGNTGGFNLGQEILVGFQPAKEGSKAKGLMYIGANDDSYILSTKKSSYSVANNTEIEFLNWWLSGALTEITYSLGLKCVYEDGSEEIVQLYDANMPFSTGFPTWEVPTTYLPKGSYDLYPIYKTDDTDWAESYYNLEEGSNYVHIESDGNTITITTAEGPVASEGKVTSSTPVSLACNGEEVDNVIAGNIYEFTWEVEVDGVYEKDLYMIVTDSEMKNLVLSSDESVNVKFAEAGKAQFTWTVDVPDDITADTYVMCLAYEGNNNSLYFEGNAYYLPIEGAGYITGSLESITINGADVEELKVDSTYEVTYEIQSTGKYAQDTYLLVTDENVTTIKLLGNEALNVAFDEAGTKSFTWELTIPADMPLGTYKIMIAHIEGQYYMIDCDPSEITISETEGIESIEADNENAQYFDIQGLKVSNPRAGQFLIKRNGNKVEKIFVK